MYSAVTANCARRRHTLQLHLAPEDSSRRARSKLEQHKPRGNLWSTSWQHLKEADMSDPYVGNTTNTAAHQRWHCQHVFNTLLRHNWSLPELTSMGVLSSKRSAPAQARSKPLMQCDFHSLSSSLDTSTPSAYATGEGAAAAGAVQRAEAAASA